MNEQFFNMSKPEKFTNLVQQILKNNKLDFKPSEYTYFWELISEYGENNTLYIYEIIRQACIQTKNFNEQQKKKKKGIEIIFFIS